MRPGDVHLTSLSARIGAPIAASVGLALVAVGVCIFTPGPAGVVAAGGLALVSAAAGGLAFASAVSASRRVASLAGEVERVSTLGWTGAEIEPGDGSDEIADLQTAVSSLSRSTFTTLSSVTRALRSMAGGDLTVDLPGEAGNPESKALVARLEEMRASLSAIVGNAQTRSAEVASAAQALSSSLEEVSSSIEEVAATIQEVTRAAQNQSEQVTQASHSLGQTAVRLRGASSEAQHVAERVKATSELAAGGRRNALEASGRVSEVTVSVDQSARVVRALAERVQQVTELVNVIVRISDQTNLLALNAAIEAARAGEHGRGFAVVAEEVRKLAEDSARSAEEVQRVMLQIGSERERVVEAMDSATKEVHESARVVTEAIRGFEEVTEQVNEITSLVTRIAEGIAETAERGEGVTRNVESISTSAEGTAASAQEVSAAIEEQTAAMESIASTSQDLARTAADQFDSVRRFRVASAGAASRAEPSGASSASGERRARAQPADLPPMFRPPRGGTERRRLAEEVAGRVPLTREAERHERGGAGGQGPRGGPKEGQA